MDRSKSKKLLNRGIVRLVTPGTLSEPLSEESNYLMSVLPGPGTLSALAWIDISTTQFEVIVSCHGHKVSHGLLAGNS